MPSWGVRLSLGAGLSLAALLLATPAEGFTGDDVPPMRARVREMFGHAYGGYMRHAFPMDELRPISCQGMETWGNYSLTLVDTLDTLVVMGEEEEFHRQAQWVWEHLRFDRDVNVSVFETNIRVLGGLLAAHCFYEDRVVDPAAVGYRGQLLDLAADLGYRLLVAFDTETGIPYGTVNLLHGVPKGETPITSTASGGTFLLEFTTLGRLIGDPAFEHAARRATVGLFERRSGLGLVGNHINVTSGEWTHKDAGIGSGIDSYYEYQLKAFILFGDLDAWAMFNDSRAAIERWLHKPPWYIEANMNTGATVWPVYNSLQSFWPGAQALSGELPLARDTVKAMHGIWRRYGAVPEGFNLLHGRVQPGQARYPLRPELAESLYYLHRATHDPVLLAMGRDMVFALNTRARTQCGFATIEDVEGDHLTDRMESFFLSETLKYLYLLFNPASPFHDGYVFTTEGHPLPIRATHPVSPYWRGSPSSPSASRPVPPAPPRPDLVAPIGRRDLQCPRPSYWRRIGVCDMEVTRPPPPAPEDAPPAPDAPPSSECPEPSEPPPAPPPPSPSP